MTIDNAVIHSFPHSPCIAKAAVNLRRGNKIMFPVVLRDVETCEKFLYERFPEIPHKQITHKA